MCINAFVCDNIATEVFMRSSRVGSASERFAQRFSINQTTGCWEWTGYKNAYGYGVIAGEINGKRYVKAGQQMLAHRVAWILFRGEIPEGDGYHGSVVMHTCDNPGCVNPVHLKLGTQADNVRDMEDKRRHVVGARLKQTGIDHFRSLITRQEEVELICSGKHQNAELAQMFNVSVDVIKRVKRQNGAARPDPDKYRNKPLSQEAIDHIRSTPPGTRGLGKLYGVGKTTIANIRKGLTHAR
jgi:hypothetical protein